MKVIYISGPYRADTVNGVYENIQRARTATIGLWRQGYAVICPHLNTSFMDGICQDDVWLEGDLELLRRADAIYMLRGWQKSDGAIQELNLAIETNKEIFYELP